MTTPSEIKSVLPNGVKRLHARITGGVASLAFMLVVAGPASAANDTGNNPDNPEKLASIMTIPEYSAALIGSLGLLILLRRQRYR